MKKNLIHEKMKRAFPQTDFPDRALALLYRFKEGEPIYTHELTESELEMMSDLATAGIVMQVRWPVYQFEQFAFWGYAFVWRKDLDYNEVGISTVSPDGNGLGRKAFDIVWLFAAVLFWHIVFYLLFK